MNHRYGGTLPRVVPDSFSPRTNHLITISSIMITAIFVLSMMPASDGMTSDHLKMGSTEQESYTLRFGEEGGLDPSLSIFIPGGGEVMEASLFVSPVTGQEHPEKVFVDIGLDGRPDWEYGGGIEGSFGLQDTFNDGSGSGRIISDEEGETFSFLIPEGAVIENGLLTVSSPPVPEATFKRIISAPYLDGIEPDQMDSGDLDGDGSDDLVLYDRGDGEIHGLMGSGTGAYTDVVLRSSVWKLTALRMIPDSGSKGGGVIYTSSPDNTSLGVSYLHGPVSKNMKSASISSGLPLDSIPFS
ncbi:MAG: hypothetical protein ACMUIG_10140, partial [Thermoplasmatota archaeon]